MGFDINLGSVIGPTGPKGTNGRYGANGPTGALGSYVVTYLNPDNTQSNTGWDDPNNNSGGDYQGGEPDALPEQYAFQLNTTESSPTSMITYPASSTNASYSPAGLSGSGSSTTFNYGSWANAWFIKGCKPCILNYDGTVYKYLNPNNYAQDTSGAAVTIDTNCVGNVMVEIPTVYIKVDLTTATKPIFYFANKAVDSTYHAYAHTNSAGTVLPYIYIAAYDGIDLNGKTRSVSGTRPNRGTIVSSSSAQRSNCQANGSAIWDMFSFSDYMLIVLLLMLIGKSTNTQAVFGNSERSSVGSISGSETTEATYHDVSKLSMNTSGDMNTKGLFWGTSMSYDGVKVFGIENFWGNCAKRMTGLLSVGGGSKSVTLKYKLTKGTHDGSTATDYNWTGDGYQSISISSIYNSNYIKEMYVGAYGLLPKTTGASSTTYYCDKVTAPAYTNGKVNTAHAGDGDDGSGTSVALGAFTITFNDDKKMDAWKSVTADHWVVPPSDRPDIQSGDPTGTYSVATGGYAVSTYVTCKPTPAS